jgi:gliding motility-associated-like protein
MRSEDTVSANYSHVGTVPATGASPVMFTDVNVTTDKKSYYYKVINVDSCGFDGMETNIGRTILTIARSQSDFTNTVVWNDYENWLGNVMSYNIYRGIDGVMDPVPIANVPFTGSDSNVYIDDISMLMQGQGVFNYYVEALEGMGNSYGFSDNSISNIAEAYQDPQVFIPNSFKPSGYNSIFLPVTSFVNISEYEFHIFNRWGLKMFSTTDVNEGWDGTNSGKKSELGVYVYLLRFRTSRGDYIDRKGTVTLLR